MTGTIENCDIVYFYWHLEILQLGMTTRDRYRYRCVSVVSVPKTALSIVRTEFEKSIAPRNIAFVYLAEGCLLCYSGETLRRRLRVAKKRKAFRALILGSARATPSPVEKMYTRNRSASRAFSMPGALGDVTWPDRMVHFLASLSLHSPVVDIYCASALTAWGTTTATPKKSTRVPRASC